MRLAGLERGQRRVLPGVAIALQRLQTEDVDLGALEVVVEPRGVGRRLGHQ